MVILRARFRAARFHVLWIAGDRADAPAKKPAKFTQTQQAMQTGTSRMRHIYILFNKALGSPSDSINGNPKFAPTSTRSAAPAVTINELQIEFDHTIGACGLQGRSHVPEALLAG